jgi:hypothetical protein
MLVIRTEQMDAFKKAGLRRFEDTMVIHLFQFSQRHCEAIGEEKVREVIRLGIHQANKYKLTNRGPVRFYIEIMFLFGSFFDTDPQIPWAAEILNIQVTDQIKRADILYEKTMDYLDKVVGPNGTYALNALRSVSLFTKHPLPLSSENFANGMLNQLHMLYPEKCAYTGEAALRTLIREGIDKAEAHRFSAVRSTTLFIMLMFALGHGFFNDPLFPWIVNTLRDSRIVDPPSRAKRLEHKMIVYLENVLDHAERT